MLRAPLRDGSISMEQRVQTIIVCFVGSLMTVIMIIIIGMAIKHCRCHRTYSSNFDTHRHTHTVMCTDYVNCMYSCAINVVT